MSFPQQPQVSASSPSDIITARPISQIASPLLLKRLQQQKRKLAENSNTTSPISTSADERRPVCHSPTTNNDQMAPIKPTPPSARSNPSRRGDTSRRIEGMGAREMDQYLSKLKKENFDLKLTLYHSREKTTKTEHELTETHSRLTGILSRNAELTELNDQLYTELEARDQALGDAVRMITTYEDRVAELETLLRMGGDQRDDVQQEDLQTQTEHQDDRESLTVPDLEEVESIRSEGNCPNWSASSDDKKSGAPNYLTVGISPFAHRPSPRLATPFRPRTCGPGGRLVSPSPSINANLIDLNTPLSGSRNTSSFLRSAFACVDTHTPLRSRTVSSNMSFINRCSSVMSDSPGGLQAGQSPEDDFVLDSPRLSELSDSSFASMYGERENEISEESGDEGEPLSDDGDSSVYRGTSSNSRFHRVDEVHRSETPNRRISPRREIIGFRVKEQSGESAGFARNVLPPTPESISPRKINGFKLIDDEIPTPRLPQSPVSSSEGKSIEASKCSTYGTDESDRSLSTSGINTPSTPPPGGHEEPIDDLDQNVQGRFEVDCGSHKPSPHRGQSFAEITNTHKRLGYRDRPSRGEGVRKPMGRAETSTLPRYVNSRIGGARGGACGGRQGISAKAPPPVKTSATFASLPPTNLHTPPWTPRTPDSETTKRGSRICPVIKRKDSWESVSSSLEKLVVKTKGGRGNGVLRRNTIAQATSIATPPKKTGDTPTSTSVVGGRKSSIPALVRSNTTGSRDSKGITGRAVKEKGRRNVN